LRQQGIGMGANVFQSVVVAVEDIDADFLAIDLGGVREVFLNLVGLADSRPTHDAVLIGRG